MHQIIKIVLSIAAVWLLIAVKDGKAEVLSPQTLKIGVTVPLTGPLAHIGEDIRDGMQLAIEQLPADGPKFQLIFEDDRHDLRQAVTATQKLLSADDADVIVSLWDCADVVAPLTEQKKRLHFAIRWDPDVAAHYSYTFTLESTYQSYSHDQAELLQALGVHKIAILQDEGKGWGLAADALEKNAGPFGISVADRQTYVTGEHDFRPVLLRLLRSKPDFLVLESLPPDTQLILKQLHEIRPEQRHTGYYEILEEPEVAGPDPFIAQFAAVEEFSKEFQARFGHPFRLRAPHAHALIELLTRAVEEFNSHMKLASKPDGTELVKALMTIHGLPTAVGPLTVGPQRSIENPNVIKILRDGKFVTIGVREASPFARKEASKKN